MTDDVGRNETSAAWFEASADDFEAMYRAAMESAVVIDRSDLGRVAVRGADRAAFLHNMLSADIKTLAPGGGREGTFLTNKGKLVASFTVFHDDDRFLLEMDSERVDPLMGALSRYIISEDVTLEDLRVDETSFSVEGPDAGELVAELTGSSVAELVRLEHLAIINIEGARVTARHRDPSPRFDVAAPASRVSDLLYRARELGAVFGSAALAETRRIEAGRPRFGVDVDESHMPLEAGLDDAISFDKGCYIGQEYVVRLAHRGHLNRKLVGLELEGKTAPPSGATVSAGDRDAGELTSAAYSPKLGAVVALAFVRKELFEPGTAVTVDGRSGTVTGLPFV